MRELGVLIELMRVQRAESDVLEPHGDRDVEPLLAKGEAVTFSEPMSVGLVVKELHDVFVRERDEVLPVLSEEAIHLAHALELARNPVDGQPWLTLVAFSWFMATFSLEPKLFHDVSAARRLRQSVFDFSNAQVIVIETIVVIRETTLGFVQDALEKRPDSLFVNFVTQARTFSEVTVHRRHAFDD